VDEPDSRSRYAIRTHWAPLVWGVALVVSAVLPIWPRTVAPQEAPGLELDDAASLAVIRRDVELASRVPATDKAQQLKRMFLDQGLAERTGGETEGAVRARSQNRASLIRTVSEADRGPLLERLRAWATVSFDELVEGFPHSERRWGVPSPVQFAARGIDTKREDLLGSFPEMLERYGLMINGTLRAPELVARTLYKARWNAIHGIVPAGILAHRPATRARSRRYSALSRRAVRRCIGCVCASSAVRRPVATTQLSSCGGRSGDQG
jgi:hypothetical protein